MVVNKDFQCSFLTNCILTFTKKENDIGKHASKNSKSKILSKMIIYIYIYIYINKMFVCVAVNVKRQLQRMN